MDIVTLAKYFTILFLINAIVQGIVFIRTLELRNFFLALFILFIALGHGYGILFVNGSLARFPEIFGLICPVESMVISVAYFVVLYSLDSRRTFHKRELLIFLFPLSLFIYYATCQIFLSAIEPKLIIGAVAEMRLEYIVNDYPKYIIFANLILVLFLIARHLAKKISWKEIQNIQQISDVFIYFRELIFVGILVIFSTGLIWAIYFIFRILDQPGNAVICLVIQVGILYHACLFGQLVPAYVKGKILHRKNETNASEKYAKNRLADVDKINLDSALSSLIQTKKIFRNESLSLQMLAQMLSVSPILLSQYINTEYKKTFREFANFHRIEDAKILLRENTEMKIIDIAYSAGFNSISSFNTAFRQITGTNPNKYRKNNIV